ncbi:HTH-type transcriptional regulator CdhR [bioreactor metagenome]|uniref:HTH-type transcriptional regulator CdhR n=1 Tax=bioreactor metagenome TaxID=1076179 RepID=A0A645EK11_9ZZZZ
MELALSIDKEIPPQLTRCIDIMKVNLSQMITIGEIAEKLGCSTSTLEELFKRHFHTTPRKYFDDLKYDKAKQLLASTALPLSEIARSIGYRHTMHFSRAFRNRVGMTPTEFRKKKTE